MKKSRMRDNILKRILCVMLIVCMVSPSVVTYASTDIAEQKEGNIGNIEGTVSLDNNGGSLEDPVGGVGNVDKSGSVRTDPRVLSNDEAALSVTGVYYENTEEPSEPVSLEETDGAYRLSGVTQNDHYSIGLVGKLMQDNGAWDIIEGDSYVVTISSTSDSMLSFVPDSGSVVYTDEEGNEVDLGTFTVADSQLKVIFNSLTDELQSLTEIPMTLELSLDVGDMTAEEKQQEVILGIASSSLRFTFPETDSTLNNPKNEGNNILNSGETPSETMSDVTVSENGYKISGYMTGQKKWNDKYIAPVDEDGKLITDYNFNQVGTFSVSLSNNVKDSETATGENRTIGFEVDSNLDSKYLEAVNEIASDNKDYDDSKMWWENPANTDGLTSPSFRVNLGKNWEKPLNIVNTGNVSGLEKFAIDEDIALIDKEIQYATAKFTYEGTDNAQDLILTVTYNTQVIYYNTQGVNAGLGFSMDIAEDKVEKMTSYEVKWNEDKELVINNTSGSGGGEGAKTGFELSKTVEGGYDPEDTGGEKTTISDNSFTYIIKANKWEIAEQTQNPKESTEPPKTYLSLNGATLTDVLPVGLKLVHIKENGRLLDDAAVNALWNEKTRTITYEYPDADPSTFDDRKNFLLEITVELDRSAIDELNGNDSTKTITFKNVATLSSAEIDKPITAEQETTVKKAALNKEGHQDSLNGNRIKWTITAETYFSGDADSYIIDRISGNVQTYDKDTVIIDVSDNGGTKLSVVDLTQTPLEYDLYNELKYGRSAAEGPNTPGAELVRKLLKEQTAAQDTAYLFKAIYSDQTAKECMDYVLIIPYADYQNGKHEITYDTTVNDKITDAQTVTNDVNLVWDHNGKEPGPGPFDWDISINKGPVVVKDYLNKAGIGYDEKTQEITWELRIDPYGKGLTDNVTLEDIFNEKVQTLIPGSLSLQKYKNESGNFVVDGSKVMLEDGEETAVVDSKYTLKPCNADGTTTPNESAFTHKKLTILLGNTTANMRYVLQFKTKVVDPAILTVEGVGTVSNKATIKAGSLGEPVAVEGSQGTINNLIEKSYVENGTNGVTYDFADNAITWEVIINQNNLPIVGANLVETLPFGSELTKWSVQEITDVTAVEGKFAEGNKNVATFSESGVTITKGTTEKIAGTGTEDGVFTTKDNGEFTQRKETFTFSKSVPSSKDVGETSKFFIDKKYKFHFTTTFKDKLFLQAFLMNKDNVYVRNHADLNGTIYGGTIKAAADAKYEIKPQPVHKSGVGTHEDMSDALDSITWTLDINRSKADIQGAQILEDFSNSGLLELDTDSDPISITCKEMMVNADGTLKDGDPKTVSADRNKFNIDGVGVITPDASPQKFTLAINDGEPFKKCIRLVFKTYITDNVFNPSDLTNKVIVNQKGGYTYNSKDFDSDYKVEFDFDTWAGGSPLPMLRVTKYSSKSQEGAATKYYLPGAVMQLDRYNESEGKWEKTAITKTKTTNSSGIANFVNLKKNVIYDLYEKSAPNGYTLSEEHQYFKFVEVDEQGDITPSTEKVKLGGLEKEVTVKLIKKNNTSGYIPTDRNTEYANTPTEGMKIQIKKLDGDGKALGGITFKLIDPAGKLAPREVETNSISGVAVFENIDQGEYELQEVFPANLKEYQAVSPIRIKVGINEDNTANINILNNPSSNSGKLTLDTADNGKGILVIKNLYKKGTIKLKKVDAVTGIGLQGAEFALYRGADITQTAVKTATSSDDGIITFTDVPYYPEGYTVAETKAPTGYKLDSTTLSIPYADMPKNDGSFNIDLTRESSKQFNDQRLTASITFNKYLSVESNSVVSLLETVNSANVPMLNRTFVLTYLGNDQFFDKSAEKYGFEKVGDKWVKTISASQSLNGSPTYTFTDIPLGKYQLTEKSSEAPGDHYTTFSKDIDLMQAYVDVGDSQQENFVYQVTSAGASPGEVINEYLKASVYLSKMDFITEEPLSEAVFSLEGHPADHSSITIKRENLVTGEDGRLTISDLPIGTYTLTETKAPENYVIGGKYTITVVSEYDDVKKVNVAKAYIKQESSNESSSGTLCSDEQEPYPIPNNAIEGTLNLKKIGSAVSEGVLEDVELSGVTFNLTPVVKKEDGSWTTIEDKVFSGVTDTNGILEINELPYGNYLLSEVAPDGYFAMNPVLLLKEGADKESCYDFRRDEKPDGGITGFNWNGGYYSAVEAAGEQGNVSYSAGDERQSYSTDEGNVIKDNPVVTNAKFTKIVIKDVTAETPGQLLEGAKFTIERLGSGGGVDDPLKFGDANDVTKGYKSYALCDPELVSDKKGEVAISNLVCGTYRITETDWPQGSRPVDAVPEVVMYLKIAKSDMGGEFYITAYDRDGEDGTPLGEPTLIAEATCRDDVVDVGVVANSEYKLGMVNFTKVGSGGNKPLMGAVFGLYRKNTETNEYSPVTMYPNGENVTTVTGDRGTGIFRYLTYGTYAIKELEAPDGHILDNTYYEFEISKEKLEGVISNKDIIENIIKNTQNSFQIQKQDVGGQLLNGAVFTVTGKFADTSTSKSYTVNGISTPIVGQLIAGEKYVIREITAPAGYSIAAQVTVYIDENGQLYDSAENKIADNKVIIKDEMIDMGLYKVSAENFSSAGTSAVTRLEGAEFTVSPVTGSVFADGSKSITINDQNYSIAFKGKLVAGNSYTVTETKAPYGYTVAAPFTFSVNAHGGVSIASTARNYVKASTSGQLVIYVADEQGTGDVTLVKKDAGSSEELSGAGFKLYRKSTAGTYALVADKTLYTGNTYKMTGTSAIDNGTANSPANGKLTVSGLPWGSYQFVEVEAPAGYVLDGTPYTFDITGTKANGMSVDLGTVKNQKTAVKVSKVDESGAALGGATLAILNSDGKEEERWVTDGTVHIISGLVPGATYKLHEVKAPAGYELADDITFTVPANGQYELSMTDIKKPTPTPTPGGITGSVVVTKTVFYEGKPLAIHDLSFYAALYSDADLTNRVSEIMELAFTGSYSTTATFDNLPLGTYYVAEVDEFGDVYDGSDIGMEVEVIDQQCVLTQTSPRGSAVIKNTMPELPDGFYIDPTGKLTVTKKVLNKDKTEATVKNTSFYVTLFSDEDYLLAVSDPMEIEITNGSSGTVIFDELALGTYYLAETDEDGFPVDAESDDFAYTPVFSKDSFEIADENQSVEVTLTNTLKKGEVTPTATPKATVTTKPGTYSSSPAKSTLSTGTSSKAANAKTGDETPLFWYFLLLAAASAGIILAAGRKRKRMK